MEYLPAFGAGIVIVAVATMLRFFFKLLAWEHTVTEMRASRGDPGHHRWLHAKRRHPAPALRTRELARR